MIVLNAKKLLELRNLAVFSITGLLFVGFVFFIDEGHYSLSLHQIFSLEFLGAFFILGMPIAGLMILINELLSRKIKKNLAFLISICTGVLAGFCLLLIIYYALPFLFD